jgi:hypothetical protein
MAPMPLTTYSETAPYSTFIKEFLQKGIMPPWSPDTTYTRFRDERIITLKEKNEIIDWINQGCIKGDTSNIPNAPIYLSEYGMPEYKLHGTPDLVLKMPTYTSKAITEDDHICVALPTGLLADRMIRAIEVVPGNPAIVHHLTLMEDSTGTATSDTSGKCFQDGSNDAVIIGVYAPGAQPIIFPDHAPLKIGVRLKARSTIIMSIHYPAGTATQQDSTKLRFFFYPVSESGIRQVYSSIHIRYGKIDIPPNTIKQYSSIYPRKGTLEYPLSIYSCFSHQHLIGKKVKVLAYKDADSIPLIRINNWDFRWQQYYNYHKLVKIPAGYTFTATHVYDNTANNLANPFNPPQTIIHGRNSTNEMLTDFFQYLPYMPGDDTIDIDRIIATDTLITGALKDQKEGIVTRSFTTAGHLRSLIGYALFEPADVTLSIYNLSGQRIRKYPTKKTSRGYYEITWDGKNNKGEAEPQGIYYYIINAGTLTSSGKLLMLH